MDKASAKQLELLRGKTPEQRFAMMSDLMDAQFESMRAGIKYYNPAATEAELDELVKERLRKSYSLRH
ncbi:MAG: hypothetical protein RQ748_06505 [Elusimicrobiales bacterium]|jgi:hypothetical protein|nr:hypothetical protein [Elusimicrobiales bacterium]